MRQVKGFDEQSVHTGWRRVTRWYPGVIRKIKRASSKRERREGKREAQAAQGD